MLIFFLTDSYRVVDVLKKVGKAFTRCKVKYCDLPVTVYFSLENKEMQRFPVLPRGN